MTMWLDPLRAALDDTPRPVDFFFRDDDAGWDDERLFAMLEVVEGHSLPLDLAVIPEALAPSLGRALLERSDACEGRLGLHQHGLAHRSHEPEGRKCEFGPSRGREAQRRDLVEGQRVLDEWLPGRTQPVFTPPWNRCTRVTAEVLAELGFRVLSRHVSEPGLAVPGLAEMPVSVDWSYAKRDGRRLGDPVGVNLHHAVMDDEELGLLDELCGLLAAHDAVRCRPLLALAG